MAWPEIKLENRRTKGKNGGLKVNWKLALTILFATKSLSLSAAFGEFSPVAIDGAIGNVKISNGEFHLSNTSTNGIIFACQPFSGNGEISARIVRSTKSSKVGLLFRQNTNAESLNAGMFLAATNTIFERQIAIGESIIVTTRTNENWEWLRVVREGSSLNGFYSNDGKDWTQISADTIEMPENIFVGFAISGVGEADVKNLRLTSAKLVGPSAKEGFTAPTNIVVEAVAETFGSKLKRVEFFSGPEKIDEMQTPPFRFVWTNALAGTHSIAAKITDDLNAEFFTESMDCEVRLPLAQVKFLGVDEVTKGNWKNKYGSEGFCIIGHATNYPAFVGITSSGYKKSHLTFTNSPGALQLTNESARILAGWQTVSNMLLDVSLLDGKEHQIALYCQDWGANLRSQTIEAIEPVKGTVLDTQRAAEFANGKYFVWKIQGMVRFRITQQRTGSAVVSGIFFDASSH